MTAYPKKSEPLFSAAMFLLGLTYALCMFGVDFFTGRGIYWDSPAGDMITHAIGGLYFIKDDWRFPLYFVPQFGYPEGANIVFSDSIPLVATGMKILYHLTGITFNYFGYFIVSCYALLALMMAKVAKQIGIEDRTLRFGVVILALCCPALATRYHHAALMAHFLLVWALLLYFRFREEPKNNWLVLNFSFAVLTALLLQSYFVVMMFPIILAAQFQALAERKVTITRLLLSIGFVMCVIVVAAWCFGVIGQGLATPSAAGFGYYSMNLLSPILPPNQNLPKIISNLVTWDIRNFSWDATGGQTGGQVEGYNYLGMGLIVLSLIGFSSLKIVKNGLRNHAFLTAAMFGLFAYSLSNRVYIGDWLAIDIQLTEWQAKTIGIFRSGGRMIWPLYYILIIAAMVAVCQRFKMSNARRIVAFTVALQLLDTFPISKATSVATSVGFPQALNKAAWSSVLAEHKFLAQYPPFQCGGMANQTGTNVNLELLYSAAQLGLSTNSVYLSRPTNHNCESDLKEGLAFDIKREGVYVFSGNFPIVELTSKSDFPSLCREFFLGTASGIVCTKNWNNIPDASINQTFLKIEKYGQHPYALDTKLIFGKGSSALQFLEEGWSQVGETGIWSFASSSSLKFQLPRDISGDLKVNMTSLNFTNAEQPLSIFKVSANNVRLADLSYRAGDAPESSIFVIPAGVVAQSNGELQLNFEWLPDAVPQQSHIPLNSRLKGIWLSDLTIQKAN
jgi:Family of unknown function (DUF6311)